MVNTLEPVPRINSESKEKTFRPYYVVGQRIRTTRLFYSVTSILRVVVSSNHLQSVVLKEKSQDVRLS